MCFNPPLASAASALSIALHSLDPAQLHELKRSNSKSENTTDTDQSLEIKIVGADLSGEGQLWRLASAEENGQNPNITHLPATPTPGSLTLPRFSVSIYELKRRN